MDIKKIGLWTGGIVAALFIARDLQDRMELGSLNKASELGKIRDEWLISDSVLIEEMNNVPVDEAIENVFKRLTLPEYTGYSNLWMAFYDINSPGEKDAFFNPETFLIAILNKNYKVLIPNLKLKISNCLTS